MALTLNSTLATAQDSMERKPLVEIISAQFVADIPFDGQLFNLGTDPEEHPAVIFTSTGRIACIVSRDGDLIYIRTNTDRTEWSETSIYDGISGNEIEASLCEMSSGNFGIIFILKSGSNRYLKWMIISQAGEIVSSAQDIATYPTATSWISSPHVIKRSDNTYLLVYAHKDSSDIYAIGKRTSSTFLTWSSQSLISPSGLDNTMRIDNTSLALLSSGKILLAFDYLDSLVGGTTELVNCYMMESTDGGSTWGSPDKVTDYSVPGSSGKDPVIAERDDNSIEFAYHEENTVLKMDKTATGWDQCDCAYCGSQSSITDIHFDPASNKLYAINKNTYSSGVLCAALVIDVDTWTIDKSYTCETTPALDQGFDCRGILEKGNGAGKYIVAANGASVMLIDTEADTITYYHFYNDAGQGISQNIKPDFKGVSPILSATWLDLNTNRLYVLFFYGYFWSPRTWFGYIDITEQADPITGMYSWNEVFETTRYSQDNIIGFDSMTVVPEADMVMLSFTSFYQSTGLLHVCSLTSGALIYEFYPGNPASFHRHGALDPIYYNNHIYANVTYESQYGMGDYRGLMDINLETNQITYHRPSWGTYDNYNLGAKKLTGDGRIVMTAYGYGITIFNTADSSWELFNNSSVPGMCDGYYTFKDVDYDPETKTIFTSGIYAPPYDDQGLFAFNKEGSFKQCKYMTGEYSTGWTFDDPKTLTDSHFTYQPVIAIDDEDALWCLWTAISGTELSAAWDKEAPELDLSDYLTGSVTAKWNIDGPASLEFSLSNGHLFDPSNLMSTLNQFVEKGRKIQLRFGELIGDTEYWQNQGTFIVTEIKLSHKRGSYPTISVQCEDMRTIWKESNIIASDYYSDDYPEDILDDLVKTFGNLTSEQIDIPQISGRHTLYHQFIDQPLQEMIDDILNHFGYFSYMDMDGKFTIKQIDLGASVSHIFVNTTIIDLTPDDSFSSFTNRVVVKGEGRYFVEVLYDLESVGTLSGTTGWWGKKEVNRIWYSDDHERVCHDPQLEINQSVKDFEAFGLKWGGGDEYISDEDPDGKWVEITIQAPNLVGLFIATVGLILATGVKALGCEANKSCGGWIFALSIQTNILGYLLGVIASYNYEIYAKPVGNEKQTFQAEANDTAFQRKLNGLAVTEEFEDPFCYTIQSCQNVADQELAVVMAQRNRVSFSKIAHLQDEIGDVVQLQHPYSGSDVKVFITNLSRTFEKSENGHFTDQIEGWRLV